MNSHRPARRKPLKIQRFAPFFVGVPRKNFFRRKAEKMAKVFRNVK
jgi:hypothetical protein